MNIGAMMKQVQEMQGKMQELQTRLGEAEISGQSGGGMVDVTLTGKGEARKIKIDPKLANPAEIDMLEDLIVAAFNDARAKVERHVADETGKIMGNVQLPPGMKLPF